MTVSQLTALLGWASIINIAYLLFATLVLIFMRDTILSIHAKLFNFDDKALSEKYFDFLSLYKVITLVLVVAPYLALKIMAY